MTSFLTLFRQGNDTAQIAAMTGETEAIVYNMMHRERISEHMDKVAAASKAPLVRPLYNESISVDQPIAAKHKPLIAYAGKDASEKRL